mmetsp:Transcript_25385/g.54610  ORF Transcript_25385/g.54610 Transcript_25385/m.54610 type:complete len:228 (+) Transcript_25385:1812-2495(+)
MYCGHSSSYRSQIGAVPPGSCSESSYSIRLSSDSNFRRQWMFDIPPTAVLEVGGPAPREAYRCCPVEAEAAISRPFDVVAKYDVSRIPSAAWHRGNFSNTPFFQDSVMSSMCTSSSSPPFALLLVAFFPSLLLRLLFACCCCCCCSITSSGSACFYESCGSFWSCGSLDSFRSRDYSCFCALPCPCLSCVPCHHRWLSCAGPCRFHFCVSHLLAPCPRRRQRRQACA